MNIFNELPQKDIEFLHNYLVNYSDGGETGTLPCHKMEYWLRYWSENKEHLYKMFGNQFILKREIEFAKCREDIIDELWRKFRDRSTPANKMVDKFRSNLEDYILDKIDYYSHYELRSRLMDLCCSYDFLAENVYTGASFIIPKQFTVNNKELVVSSGCKAVKMIGKIAKAFGVEEGFEEFRQAHSQVLNQKTLRGTLCLSIHPLDYITMSDNDCGWSSCMAWVEDRGDYRLGTIEMMNSPNVVVAYLDATDPFIVPGCGEWSNKKWRQLIVITPEMILGNRQYPYDNPVLQGEVLNWMRELAQNAEYGVYEDTATMIYNNRDNSIKDKMVYFNLYMNYMYNDIYDGRMAFISENFNRSRYDFCVSGPAVCTGCGCIIESGDNESYAVRCMDCDDCWKCHYCGDHYTVHDNRFTVDGEWVCEYCYYDESAVCECCGDRTFNTYSTPVVAGSELAFIDRPHEYNVFNKNFYITSCADCFASLKAGDYVEECGDLVNVDRCGWGKTLCVNIKTMSDIAIDSMQSDDDEKEFLKSVRDAKTQEEELELIRKFLY